MTLERRRKQPEKPAGPDADDQAKEELREASEAARRHASLRAAELLARLRKL